MNVGTTLDELMQRERMLQWPESMTMEDLDRMLGADFTEIGASGRCYSRAEALAVLDQRRRSAQAEVRRTRDFECREIAPDVFLLTYVLLEPQRTTRRSTIWKHAPEGWSAVFHQGTIIQS